MYTLILRVQSFRSTKNNYTNKHSRAHSTDVPHHWNSIPDAAYKHQHHPQPRRRTFILLPGKKIVAGFCEWMSAPRSRILLCVCVCSCERPTERACFGYSVPLFGGYVALENTFYYIHTHSHSHAHIHSHCTETQLYVWYADIVHTIRIYVWMFIATARRRPTAVRFLTRVLNADARAPDLHLPQHASHKERVYNS